MGALRALIELSEGDLAALTERMRMVRKVGMLGAEEPPGRRRGTSFVVALQSFPINNIVYIGHGKGLKLLLEQTTACTD